MGVCLGLGMILRLFGGRSLVRWSLFGLKVPFVVFGARGSGFLSFDSPFFAAIFYRVWPPLKRRFREENGEGTATWSFRDKWLVFTQNNGWSWIHVNV